MRPRIHKFAGKALSQSLLPRRQERLIIFHKTFSSSLFYSILSLSIIRDLDPRFSCLVIGHQLYSVLGPLLPLSLDCNGTQNAVSSGLEPFTLRRHLFTLLRVIRHILVSAQRLVRPALVLRRRLAFRLKARLQHTSRSYIRPSDHTH